MRYHLRSKVELDRAAAYLSTLATKEATVDITRVSYNRSLNQNAYYHLMLSYFGTEVGATLEEVKVLIRELQSELYKPVQKVIANIPVRTTRSSADFTTQEMTRSIDQFRTWAQGNGVSIPAPDDVNFIQWAQDQVAQNTNYL